MCEVVSSQQEDEAQLSAYACSRTRTHPKQEKPVEVVRSKNAGLCTEELKSGPTGNPGDHCPGIVEGSGDYWPLRPKPWQRMDAFVGTEH